MPPWLFTFLKYAAVALAAVCIVSGPVMATIWRMRMWPLTQAGEVPPGPATGAGTGALPAPEPVLPLCATEPPRVPPEVPAEDPAAVPADVPAAAPADVPAAEPDDAPVDPWAAAEPVSPVEGREASPPVAAPPNRASPTF